MTSVPSDCKAAAAAALPFHPIATFFPLIEGDDFDLLVADIREHGLNAPIVKFNGYILDGRNRYRACLQEKIQPRFEEYTGNDPVGFVISRNLRRRHLTTGQRAQIGAKLATVRQGERTDLKLPANLPKVDQLTAAKMLAVSERSLGSAVTVLKSGAPELQRAVEQGTIAVSNAAKIARQPAVQQLDALAHHQQSRRTRGSTKTLEPVREANASHQTDRDERVDKAAAEIKAALSNIVAILTDHLPEEVQWRLIGSFRATGPLALIAEIERHWRSCRSEMFKAGENVNESVEATIANGGTAADLQDPPNGSSSHSAGAMS